MMGTTERHGQLSCQMANALFEKFVLEEQLSREEHEQFRKHTENCPRCGNAFRLTSALPKLALMASEGDYEAEISQVLDILQAERDRNKKRVRIGVILAAAAMPLLAILIGKSVFQDTPTEPATLNVAASACLPAASVEPVPGVHLNHCEGDALSTTVKDGMVAVSLQHGTVALSVDPNRPNKKTVSVMAPQGEVRVKGTVFAVHVDQRDNTHVEVFRGTVAVVPVGDDAVAFDVSAGHGAQLVQRQVYALENPAGQVLVDALPQSGSGAIDHTADSVEPSPDVASAAAVPQTISEISDRNGTSVSHRTTHSTGANGRMPASKSMDALIENARVCLLSHDWHCAAANYNSVLNKYARLPESNTVLISLAKIELRHLGNPQKALKHFNTYLRKVPDGPLAEEALLGMANSYRQLKLEDKEKKALQRFVSEYPNSALRTKASNRLEQLETSSASNL
ncbi:MAG: tetratricopeptide repeat protein [Deltaproteobacteria bacterium]|nr:tetratricopeptide repeat protein [Deltaproteobacteria bacterium]